MATPRRVNSAVSSLVALVTLVTGCTGSPSGANARARALCESGNAARHITDPYGAGDKVTVTGKVHAAYAWGSTAALLRGWPKGSGEGPTMRAGAPDYWKNETPDRFIAVCYIHGAMTAQRTGVPATLSHFEDALIEARDERTVFLLWARAPEQPLRVQKPPTSRG